MLGWDRDGIDVELPGLGPTRVGLRGRHQAANVAVADALLDALEEAGIATVDPDARRRGYATAVWPGRLELLDLGDGREVAARRGAQPGRRRGARPGARRPAAAPRGRAAHPGRGVDGRQGRRWRRGRARRGRAAARRHGHRDERRRARARCRPRELAERWRRVPGPRQRDRGPRPARRPSMPPWPVPGTTVVAGSLYLVGAVRAHLVDDPDLRDPDPGAPAR